MRSLATLIRKATPAELEREIFGTVEAGAIAASYGAFVARHLGVEVQKALAYEASSGCVAALELAGGARVVVKAHRPGRSAARIAACQSVQEHLRTRGVPAPEVLVPPRPLGCALGTIEGYLEGGRIPNGRDDDTRSRMAAMLHRITRAVRPEELSDPPGASWFSSIGADRIWPRPHSPIFNFDATASGAAWIDELARHARRVPRAGPAVVGHFDWRVEHLRIDAESITAIYDWDAVHVDCEPIVVACAAHAFTACWQDDHLSPPPTIDEARAFVADYQRARGTRFSADEKRCLDAAWVYATAYSARCAHALGAASASDTSASDNSGAVYIATLSAHGDEVLATGL